MTVLSVWYILGSPADQANIQLIRRTLSDGVETQIVSDSAPVTGGLRRRANYPIPDAQQTIDDARYGYYVGVCLKNDDVMTSGPSFHGARLTYTYTHAGD